MRAGRKLVAGLLALAALGVPAGCDKDDDAAGGGKAGAPKPAAGFDGKTIRLGVVTPLSGPAAVVGVPLTEGQQVWFDHVNSRGGIAGRYKVELVEEDSRFETDTTVQKYNKLKNDVVMFAQVLGTANTRAVLPQLKRDRVMAVPGSLDAAWVREPNLLPAGGPYQLEAINALDHYVNDAGGRDKAVCSIVMDDAAGDAANEGVEFAAGKLGLELATKQRFRLGDKDVTGQVQQLKRSGCDAVVLQGTPGDAGTVWGTAAKLGFAPRWIGLAPTWIEPLAKSPLAAYLRKTTWIAHEGTEWGDGSVAGMNDMLARIRRFKPGQKPAFWFPAGYTLGRAVTALLEKAVERGDLSRQGLLEASRQLGTVSFDGLAGRYRYGPAGERDPSRTSTIFAVDPKKPVGLAKLKYNHQSRYAEQFEFKPGSQ